MISKLTALLLAASAPAAAAQPDNGITFQQTMDLPPEELAARAFRDLAGRMREVTRQGDLRSHRNPQVTELVFAAAPASFDPGLCSATVVRVAMEPGPTGEARATGFITETAFKVVGDIRLFREWSAAERRTQERQCASAGPVIPPDSDLELSRAYFFTLTGAVRPAFSLQALQQAIVGARNGTYRDLVCEPESQTNPDLAPLCAQPATLLARFDLTNLTQVKIEGPREGSRYLLTAVFLVPGADGPKPWQLSLETDLTIREPPTLDGNSDRPRPADRFQHVRRGAYGHRLRKLRTAAWKARGWSYMIMWPLPSMRTSSAPGAGA